MANSEAMWAVFDVSMPDVDFDELRNEFAQVEGVNNVTPSDAGPRTLLFTTRESRAAIQQAVNDHPDHKFKGCYISDVRPE